MIENFKIARLPTVYMGIGEIKKIKLWLQSNNLDNILLIIGKSSLKDNGNLTKIKNIICEAKTTFQIIKISSEPSVELIDDLVLKFKEKKVKGIIGIGGGSVLDTAKALSAMIPYEYSVLDYIEGFGKNKTYNLIKLPFLAIPTTSGTGGEVTMNASFKLKRKNGLKKSIRNEKFIPDAVIIDGELLISAPKIISISCGLDTFTQLLESYLSPKSSPLIDAILISGFEHFIPNFLKIISDESKNPFLRQSIGYASLCSGIGLTNNDLGVVHGIAVPLGGIFDIPHGIACGKLICAANESNISAMLDREPNNKALKKMANIGKIISNDSLLNDLEYINILTKTIEKWINYAKLPPLYNYGIKERDIIKILKISSIRNNPINLKAEEIHHIIQKSYSN